MIFDEAFFDRLTEQAKASPRLRMNFNLHESHDSKAQRLFNALEPGTFLPIHRHVATDETFIVLRGKLRVTFYDDNGVPAEIFDLEPAAKKYGCQIPKNVWHSFEVLATGTAILEIKDGPYTPVAPENILEPKGKR